MLVLNKWEKCPLFNQDKKDNLCLAYFIEIHITELTNQIYSILPKEDRELLKNEKYLAGMNSILKNNPHLGHIDCVNLLISSNLNNAKLCRAMSPLDKNLWKDGQHQFVNMHGIEIFSIDEIKNIDENIINACIKAKQKAWDLYNELGIDMRINEIIKVHMVIPDDAPDNIKEEIR